MISTATMATTTTIAANSFLYLSIGGDPRLMGPEAGDSSQKQKLKSIYRARMETVFKRVKQFRVMDTRFRYSDSSKEVMMMKHMKCF